MDKVAQQPQPPTADGPNPYKDQQMPSTITQRDGAVGTTQRGQSARSGSKQS